MCFSGLKCSKLRVELQTGHETGHKRANAPKKVLSNMCFLGLKDTERVELQTGHESRTPQR